MLIGSVVPLGILLGPMMCGLYLTFFAKRRGQTIEFELLFKGFDYFGPSLIATLIHIVPMVAIFVPAYILFYVGFFMSMTIPREGGEPNPALALGFVISFLIFWLVMMVVMIVISIAFTFTYPLIVDRGLSGLDAVKMSFKAAMANFWRLLGLSLLSGALSLAGLILCYVGIILVFPITLSAIAIAYEQVFGPLGSPISNLPPPPPTFK
jgi:uncharacterized membrane protein